MTWAEFLLLTEPLARLWLGRLVFALIFILVAWQLGRIAQHWAERAGTRMRVDPNIRYLTGQLLYWLVLALGIVFVLTLVGIDASVILATFGAAWLAIGLAAQDIIKSFLAGIYLLFERPFLIGEEIEVKDKVGRVEHVGFRATSIRTAENVRVVVPNVIIFNEVVSNRSQRRESPPSAPLNPGGGTEGA
jgi:small conductance mechanosensitive channel